MLNNCNRNFLGQFLRRKNFKQGDRIYLEACDGTKTNEAIFLGYLSCEGIVSGIKVELNGREADYAVEDIIEICAIVADNSYEKQQRSYDKFQKFVEEHIHDPLERERLLKDIENYRKITEEGKNVLMKSTSFVGALLQAKETFIWTRIRTRIKKSFGNEEGL